MKKIVKNNVFKWKLWICCILLSTTQLTAQNIERSKTIEKEFSNKTAVSIDHNYGPIKVHPSTSNSVRLVVRLDVKGTSEDDIEKVMQQLKVDASEFGSKLDLNTKIEVQNWESNNHRTKIKFKDGTKVTTIKEIKVHLDLYIPKLEQLSLENRYDDIYIDNIETNLDIKLYTGKLFAGDVNGNVDLEFKYSKAEIGKIIDGDFDIYDSKIDVKGARNLKLKSKYSDGKVGPTENLDLQTYDDDFIFGQVSQKLEIEDKYSEFEFQSFATGILDVYDSKVKMDGAQTIVVNSKYSEFEIEKVDHLDFSKSYDDDWRINDLGEMQGESKYSEFKINTCSKGLKVQSYDDDIFVRNVLNTFSHLELGGKYTELEFPIPSQADYHLNVLATYGKLFYDDDRFDVKYYKEKSSKTEVKGKSRNAGEGSPKVSLDVYDCRIDLKN